MKRLFLFICICSVFACNEAAPGNEPGSITGTYLHERTFPSANPNTNIEKEGKVKEVIQITEENGKYKIVQEGMRYTPRGADNGYDSAKISKPSFVAEYDAQTNTLTGMRTTVHFRNEGKEITLGSDDQYVYTKID